jgi:hypothetical protein
MAGDRVEDALGVAHRVAGVTSVSWLAKGVWISSSAKGDGADALTVSLVGRKALKVAKGGFPHSLGSADWWVATSEAQRAAVAWTCPEASEALRERSGMGWGPWVTHVRDVGELALARTLGSGEDLRRRVLEGSDDPGLGNLLGWIDAVATSPFVIGETWGDGHEFGDDGAEYVYTTFATPRDLVQYDNLDNDAWEDVLTDAEDTLAAATAMCAATAYTCAGLTPEEVSMWVGANTSLSLLEKRVNDLSGRITGPTCEIELTPRRGSHISL